MKTNLMILKTIKSLKQIVNSEDIKILSYYVEDEGSIAQKIVLYGRFSKDFKTYYFYNVIIGLDYQNDIVISENRYEVMYKFKIHI